MEMEQRLLWAELRVSLVKFYGLLRPPTTFPANSHPWSEAGCRRPCRQGRLRPSLRRELLTSLHKSLSPQQNAASIERQRGLNAKTNKLWQGTFMSAGPASSPRFAEPACSSCTFRSPQACAAPAGHENRSIFSCG